MSYSTESQSIPIKKVFTDQVVERVRANVFPGAHAAIQDWNNFPWHTGPAGNCDSDLPHSSQALAVDVFGALQVSEQRSSVLNQIAVKLGLPTSEEWIITLEYLDQHNPLRERRLTQVDAIAESKSALIFFECKFTESDGGNCRQPLPLDKGAHKGQVQCDGNYQEQCNPVNGVTSRCALSGKGIRYWEYVPCVFKLQNDIDQDPCPFRYSWYQWMRNLTSCYAIAEQKRLKPGFAVVYADSPGLPMAQKVRSQAWQDLVGLVKTDDIAFGALSYQEIISVALDEDQREQAPWTELKTWVDRKIQKIQER